MTTEQRDGIAELLTSFCRHLDAGDGASVASLFTEGARVDTPHFRLAGRSEIERWFGDRPESRLSLHSWSNLRVEVTGPERFRVTSNMINAAGIKPAAQPPAKLAFAIATDDVVMHDGAPLFAGRTLEILFEMALPAPGGGK